MNRYRFYVYAYLRSKDSLSGKAGTPYYQGKGSGDRAYKAHRNVPVPKNKKLIVFLETNLSEVGAFALERRMIKWWGRKDQQTGGLINRTEGGEGTSGIVTSDKTRKIMSENRMGDKNPRYGCVPSESTREKISSGNKGKIKTSEFKENVRKKAIGRKHTEESRNTMSQLRRQNPSSTTTTKNLRIKRISEYLVSPNICNHCSIQLTYEKKNNKFCSISCSTTLNNLNSIKPAKFTTAKPIYCGGFIFPSRLQAAASLRMSTPTVLSRVNSSNYPDWYFLDS